MNFEKLQEIWLLWRTFHSSCLRRLGNLSFPRSTKARKRELSFLKIANSHEKAKKLSGVDKKIAFLFKIFQFAFKLHNFPNPAKRQTKRSQKIWRKCRSNRNALWKLKRILILALLCSWKLITFLSLVWLAMVSSMVKINVKTSHSESIGF